MLEQIKKIEEQIEKATAQTKEELEDFRIGVVGRKGIIADLFSQMKTVAPEERKTFGQTVNALKNAAQDKFQELQDALESLQATDINHQDLTLPNIPNEMGSVHPITKVREEISRIFERIGFNISEGPEIEDDWHNFSALNFPPNHPAREMQDTFFIEKDPDIALRTHTSSVQVRIMENAKPPFRTLSPGRVYRNETISARAHCIFHQIEGLYVDKNVSFKDLKDTLYYFAKEFFGPNSKIRLRPSYFPFTEPSAELDVSCSVCGGKGCNICKYSGWVEIGGCGMVDPNVLKASGIDPEEYTGFAFGMGIERMTMLKYKINDLRLFTENDLRFLRQFEGL
ncbi:phenylalanine--tRNA ligase subunit alpha [Flammeovirga kamogawensis]|uniref:Phenylalanine--tRNA ligase alpha subunit n=1 Tax=Flammeovirga kamogawensis TaxID=373891 RepID=A0ABX8GUC7_9BACT|nr:phenylalanine--tRNA ligase subunit alpha [Flammeovirga kamogawensis]MBB6462506.1 phenylalanyl-tRNA synthetase alpha chain [Flammeovirga kamogawensis]QWG06757.1 phenylalanine--tRNA ligase subunit alpha [Flammeovirga kamogawensis]TRX68580.1 phenylalanine--tRNA ligase subunit alpha [Flammeovirga kamogawensis]